MRKTPLIAIAAVTAMTAGCYHEAMYADESGYGGQAQQSEAPPVSTYPIPPNDPKGTVYVMSLGPERLAAPSGGPATFLHVRIAAENNGDDAAWQIDPNDETANFGGGEAVPPSYAQASSGGPVLSVAHGAHGSLDLYYSLPAQGEPPAVSLAWRVRRGADSFAQSTTFERRTVGNSGYAYYEPYGPDVHLALGLGWWWPWGWGWGPWGWGWGWGGPWWWHRPFFGYRYVPRYWSGGRYIAPGGGWRGGGGGGTVPHSSGGRGGGGWRGGHR